MLRFLKIVRSKFTTKISSNLLGELKKANKGFHSFEFANPLKLNNQLRKFSKIPLQRMYDKGDFIFFLGGVSIIGFGIICFLGGVIICLINYALYELFEYVFLNSKRKIKE